MARLLTRWRWFRELCGGLWLQTELEGWQMIAAPDNLSEYDAPLARVLRERWRNTGGYVGILRAGGYEATRSDHGHTVRDQAGDIVGAAMLAAALQVLVMPRDRLPIDLLEQLEDAEAAQWGAS
jgi:hypothetical protein